MSRRAVIVAVALLPRLVIAWLTFGSVDAIANFRNTLRIIEGLPVAAPYLSGIELWIWISSVLAYSTAVPVMFPYRLLAIACDVLIALLLFDAAGDRHRGFRAAILYAIAPISVAISAIHPQWDSIWMYFLLLALVLLRRDDTRVSALAGAAFVLSVIVKPIAAPLVIVLIPLARRRGAAFLGGGAAVAAAYVAILAAVDLLPTTNDFLGILHYAQHGVRQFGLPYRPYDRFWVTLGALAVLALLYFTKRLSREDVTLLFLATAVGVSGLTLQYLVWVIPFALLRGHVRFVALYTLAAGLFVVFYYQMPVVNLPNGENLGAFGLLHPFGSWSPPLPSPRLRPFILFLGNIVVPLSCLSLVGWRIARAVLRRDLPDVPQSQASLRPVLVLFALVGVLTAWAALQPPLQPDAFVLRVEEKIRAYDVVRYQGPSMMSAGSKMWIARSFSDPAAHGRILHIGNVFVVWVIAASAAAAFWRIRPE